ncbi:metaxin-2 [Drosophila subpulchrella]|uniref:metaxin-2 n=1 Tax=Drosophila subpulchrella TaxID=1486046 RepID=UPI0018A159EE|nr:metaxin-2 [Drosophila subpulchrella]
MNLEQNLTDALSQSPEGKAEEAWPADAHLHQPPEETQLLLAERSSCLSVKTYLGMCGLPIVERISNNAEFMSPGGRLTRLPLLRLGPVKTVAEFEPIVAQAEAMQGGQALDSWMSEDQRDNVRSLVNYVENVFTLAEIHMSFVDEVNYQRYTATRSGAAYPWPLSFLRRRAKKKEALRILKVYQWEDQNNDQVLHEVGVCADTLMGQMEQNEPEEHYFCGSRLCALDALVFGHVATILTTALPNMELAEVLTAYPCLLAHCWHIDQLVYGGKILGCEKEPEVLE